MEPRIPNGQKRVNLLIDNADGSLWGGMRLKVDLIQDCKINAAVGQAGEYFNAFSNWPFAVVYFVPAGYLVPTYFPNSSDGLIKVFHIAHDEDST